MLDRARYSALAEDLATMTCFLDFQDTNESPGKTIKPVVDLQVSKHPPQLPSEEADNLSLQAEDNKIPYPGVPLR